MIKQRPLVKTTEYFSPAGWNLRPVSVYRWRQRRARRGRRKGSGLGAGPRRGRHEGLGAGGRGPFRRRSQGTHVTAPHPRSGAARRSRCGSSRATPAPRTALPPPGSALPGSALPVPAAAPWPRAAHQRLEVLGGGVGAAVAAREGPERRVPPVALQRGGEQTAAQLGAQRVPPHRLPHRLAGTRRPHRSDGGGGEGRAAALPPRGRRSAPRPGAHLQRGAAVRASGTGASCPTAELGRLLTCANGSGASEQRRCLRAEPGG